MATVLNNYVSINRGVSQGFEFDKFASQNIANKSGDV